jgi:predicted  nucleic acid-binding Zn-ribbon protein
MDAGIREILLGIVERIDAQVPRLDAIDAELKSVRAEARAARDEARAAREQTEHLGRLVSAQGQQLRTLSDAVATIAGLQAETSKNLGALNERLARLVEGSVRTRTDDAERYAALESRMENLEQQVRALSAERRL